LPLSLFSYTHCFCGREASVVNHEKSRAYCAFHWDRFVKLLETVVSLKDYGYASEMLKDDSSMH
jgi:hypothetical protein